MYKKEKNGFIIAVKEFDNTVTVTKKNTGKVVMTQTFSDHIKAMIVFNKL